MNFDTANEFVRLRVGNHALINYDKAGELINISHSQVLEEEEWSRKSTEIIINTSADNTTGTFNVINGNTTTVGAGLTLSANNVGWYVKFGSDTAIYKIGALTGATVTLHDFAGNVVSYAGTTNATASFIAFKRWYSLGEAIEGIDSMVYDKQIIEATTARLDDWDRDRSTTTANPDYWAYGPRDTSGNMLIEFWPRANTTLAIRVKVRRGHIDLKGVDLPIVPWYVIVWKASAEACLFIQAKTNSTNLWMPLHDKYDAKYEMAKKRALEQDQKKAGLPHRIRDAWNTGSGSDFSISHDDYGW